jgi:hypothetical protein
MSRMGPNQFPFQDDILRQLAKGAATAASVSNTIASEGRAPGHGENSPELHRDVAENIDHLVNLGLAEYTGGSGDDRSANLTAVGQEAAESLP